MNEIKYFFISFFIISIPYNGGANNTPPKITILLNNDWLRLPRAVFNLSLSKTASHFAKPCPLQPNAKLNF
ncbi:MAG: hypothetical protein WAR79_19215 [Melioribacteraceae bacterium]